MEAAYLPRLCRIVRRLQETRDTFTFFLEPEDGGQFSFEPGQFNMLSVPGAGEVPISISGSPLVHTTRAVGGVTRVLERLGEGDFVGLRGPFGTGWPLDELAGRDVLVLAGGIGLAPLRPVIYHVLSNRDRFGRFAVLYGARKPGDLLFREELLGWQEGPVMDLRITVDFAGEFWKGRVGVITTLIPGLRFDPENAVALICGPEAMMRFTVRELRGRNLPANRIYVSMERNMKCAVGLCGHCQYGPTFVCKDGPVYSFDHVEQFLAVREL